MIITDYPDAILCDDGNANIYWLVFAQNPTGPNADTDVYYWGGNISLFSDQFVSYADLTASVFYCTDYEVGGGSATSSPYIIDVGSTIMLGGILAFMVAYWLVGLARYKRNKD